MLLAVLLVALTPLSIAQRITTEPFVPISVWYPATADVEAMRRDFTLIRHAGFTAVTTWISWNDGEPRRGAYNLLGIDRIIAVASEADLKVLVNVYPEPEPAWKTDGTNALAGQFYEYVRRRIASHPSVIAVEYSSSRSIAGQRAIVDDGEGSISLRQARKALWSAVARGLWRFGVMDRREPASSSVLALGEVAGVITRNAALFAPLKPRKLSADEVTVAGGGPVSVDLLESPDALVIVAINHAPAVRKVTITFAPGFPEAVWQNMEEGNSVEFVAGRNGPFLEHSFAPEDVLVLAIRKNVR